MIVEYEIADIEKTSEHKIVSLERTGGDIWGSGLYLYLREEYIFGKYVIIESDLVRNESKPNIEEGENIVVLYFIWVIIF